MLRRCLPLAVLTAALFLIHGNALGQQRFYGPGQITGNGINAPFGAGVPLPAGGPNGPMFGRPNPWLMAQQMAAAQQQAAAMAMGGQYFPRLVGPGGVVYHLFIPNAYNPRVPNSMILFTPSSNSDEGWATWWPVCKAYGIIYAAPFNAGNAVAVNLRANMAAHVLSAVRSKYNVDPDRTYCSGCSGGGKMACIVGMSLAPYFGGINTWCGSEAIAPMVPSQARLSVAMVTGQYDFNHKWEILNSQRIQQLKMRVKLWDVPGMPHGPVPSAVLAQNYVWLEADLARRRMVRFAPLLALQAGGAGLKLVFPWGMD